MDNGLVQYSDQGQGVQGVPSAPQNPLLIAHRGLRGHYLLAIVLAVALAIPMGVAGYFATKPIYTSKGLVRIEVSRTPLITATELTDAIKDIDAELQWHISMLKSEPVLLVAATSDELMQAGWSPMPNGLRQLSRALTVTTQRGSDMIVVEVAHRDPVLANIATDQILAAYMKNQDDSANEAFSLRQSDLKGLVNRLEEELDQKRKRKTNQESEGDISSLTYGLRQIDDREAFIKNEMFANQLIINQQTVEDDVPGDRDDGIDEADQSDSLDDIDLYALAQQDEELQSLLLRRRELATAVALAAIRFSEDHPYRMRKEASLRVVEGLIQTRVGLLKDRYPEAVLIQSGDSIREAAVQRNEEHKALLEDLRAERQVLIVSRAALQATEDEIKEIKRKLGLARLREDSLKVERESLKDQANVGRAFIAQKATSPLDPSTDRRIPLTVAGTLFGGGLGMGLISLFGIMRGGLRYIDEFESPAIRAPLLGCLPDLESDDERASDMAALSVHHIRSMLEVRNADPATSRTLLITSPSTGDGKTSLALSLASSFAIAGHKTVIVDGDLIGRGLTRELGLELEPGLVDSLKSGTLNGEVHATATPNLSAVPAGATSMCTPEHLSTDALRSLLAGLRDTHEYVLVDTGPVLGSIEANVLAPLSDQTILVVGRGQSNRTVRASLDRLNRLNAKCCGVVFNRADIADFSRSVSTASLSVGSKAPSGSSKKSSRGDYKSLVSVSHKNKRDM